MKRKCKKKLQEIRINPIIQLSKHYYRRSKHEAGQSMCAAMNVFFHQRKLINFSMSLSEKFMFIKRAHWAFHWPKCACINRADVWTVNLLVHGTCSD